MNRLRPPRYARIACRFVIALGIVVPTPAQAPSSRPSGDQDRPRRVEFAPGVTIDWLRLQVEVAGRVVLREGLLELFACSPHTREHESIVAVAARPLHIHQALGLIGLDPGQPVTYNENEDRRVPPSGDRLEIEVRYREGDRDRTVNIWEWMADADAGAAVAPRDWVFCGSRTYPGGVFGADAEGTIICVVDFDSALVALSEAHSADNALLWVAARGDRIPPAGTPCTLLIRAAKPHESTTTQPVEFKGPVGHNALQP